MDMSGWLAHSETLKCLLGVFYPRGLGVVARRLQRPMQTPLWSRPPAVRAPFDGLEMARLTRPSFWCHSHYDKGSESLIGLTALLRQAQSNSKGDGQIQRRSSPTGLRA